MVIRLGYSGTNKTQNLNSGAVLVSSSNIQRSDVEKRFKINLKCIEEIVSFNALNDIKLFRINTGLITAPFFFPYKEILHTESATLRKTQSFCLEQGIRLTMHSPVASLGSRYTDKVENNLNNLKYYAEVLQYLGSFESVIVQHVGKESTEKMNKLEYKERFINVLNMLPPTVKERISLENDEDWGVRDVVEICKKTGCMFTYDFHHHKCWPYGDFNDTEILMALKMCAVLSEDKNLTPKIHLSSQDKFKRFGGHADYVDYGDYSRVRRLMRPLRKYNFDIMIECGMKEKGVLKLVEQCTAQKPFWGIQTQNKMW
ncbi:MAG: hypothetical protein WC998_00800 [Candidatus Paceibacterota bacterium]|jgi:UV DNA damage endonuclease